MATLIFQTPKNENSAVSPEGNYADIEWTIVDIQFGNGSNKLDGREFCELIPYASLHNNRPPDQKLYLDC